MDSPSFIWPSKTELLLYVELLLLRKYPVS